MLYAVSMLREVVEQDIMLLIPLRFYTHRVAHTHMNRLFVNIHSFCCHVCQGVSATCARLSATKIFQQLHRNTISHQEILSHFSHHQSMSITMLGGECMMFVWIIHFQQRNNAIGCRPCYHYHANHTTALVGKEL